MTGGLFSPASIASPLHLNRDPFAALPPSDIRPIIRGIRPISCHGSARRGYGKEHHDQERGCGSIGLNGNGVRCACVAPRAERVELMLLEGPHRRAPECSARRRDFSTLSCPMFTRVNAMPIGSTTARSVPIPFAVAARWRPQSLGCRPPGRFSWTDPNWKGVPREDLVFYELHVGTFTPEGTFEAVIPRLPALRELGVTAVELMPVAQFPGSRNWGYDGVYLYAAQNTYGGPYGLQKLVDACHAAGLAIFLDVVYNHLGPEGNYLGEFGPYFTDRYRTSWGPALNYDAPGSDAVRDFILDNVRLWIEDFHFDGLRLDAVHAIFDSRPCHILREIKRSRRRGRRRPARAYHRRKSGQRSCVWSARRSAADTDSTPNGTRISITPCTPTSPASVTANTAISAGSAVSPGRWQQTFPPGRQFLQRLSRPALGRPDEGLPGDRFVIGVQNHDHVGNRPNGERLAALVDPAKQRLAASLMLLSPYLPLLFMGEEYGEDNPFPFFCSFQNRNLIENVRQGRRRDYGFAPGVQMLDPQAESTFAAARLSWSWPEGSHAPACVVSMRIC